MYSKHILKNLAFILVVCLSFAACAKLDLFERTSAIPSQNWYYNNVPSFSFSITDMTSAYNIFIVLRHTDAYQYNNIWFRLGTQGPGEQMHFQNLDITLATDAKGWEGSGVDDIFEVRKNITKGPVPFKKKGTYTFTIAQMMRENPVKHILNVGVRIEKVHL